MNAQQILDSIERLENQIADLNRDIAAETLLRNNAFNLELYEIANNMTIGINKNKETLNRCVAQLGSLQGKSSLMWN